MEYRRLNNWGIEWGVEKDGEIFISASILAVEFGYDRNHIGLLARQGKVNGIKIEKRWFVERESLERHKAEIEGKKVPKTAAPRKPVTAPSSVLSRITDLSSEASAKEEANASRINLRTFVSFSRGFKFILLAVFVFMIFSGAVLGKNGSLVKDIKNLGTSAVKLISTEHSEKQLIFSINKKELLKMQESSASIIDSVFSPVTSILTRLFGSKTARPELVEGFENQIKELETQLDQARLEIQGNKKLIEENLKEVTLVKERETVTVVGEERQIVTERRIVTIPSNIEARILAVEQSLEQGEQKFNNIDLALSSVNDRFSYTPTILIPSGGGGGHQGVTVSNPATTESETVKVSSLLDVSGSAEIDGALTLAGNFTVDTNAFFVDSSSNRVGIGTTSLETALEVVGTASISQNLSIGGTLSITGGTTFSSSASISGNFEVGTNKFYVDSTNGRVGINTQNLTQALEVAGTASISGDLTVLGDIAIGTSSTPFQLTVIGSGSFTGQLKATRNPTLAHTGTWPSFTNTADATFYLNPSAPVADGNVIAYVSGSDPKFVVDAEGDTFIAGNLTLSGTTTQATTTVAGDLLVEGNSRLGDAVTDTIKLTGTIRPYSLTSFPVLVKASSSQTVDVFRILDTNDNVLLTLDQGTGLLTASSGFNFALGGSTATVSYSRLGTSTTSHPNYISKFNDLLISGDFETRGTVSFGGTASISGALTTYGTNTFSGTGSSSFAGSLLVSKGFNALAIVGTALTINGNASITGNTTLGDATGDTLTANADSWTFVNDTNFVLSGGTNGLSFDTSTFSVDATNDRIGIRTTTPSTVFEVQGTASASYLLTGNTLQVGGFASAAYSRFGTSTTGHANYISTTNDLLISGDLEVKGSISANIASVSQMFIMNPAASASAFFKSNGSGGTNQSQFSIGVGNGTERLNIFNNTNNPIVTIASNGNVGIGTTGPDGKLHVMTDSAGVVTASTSADDFTVEGSTDPGISILGSGDDVLSILFGNPGTGGDRDGGIRYYQESFPVVANRRSMVFLTGSTEKMRIDSGGNVGIGTTVPEDKLHVSGSATQHLAVFECSTSDCGVVHKTANGAANEKYWQWLQSGSSFMLRTVPDDFSTGTAIMTFTRSGATPGNVGIGGSGTINAALDINGGIEYDAPAGLTASNTICWDNTDAGYGGQYIGKCASSIRYKQNVADYTNGLETLRLLRPVEFDWKHSGQRDLGFIAEEVELIDPLLVVHNEDGTPESVKYAQITAPLVNAVLELDSSITSLSFRIEDLEQRMASQSEGFDSGAIFDLDILFNSIVKKFYEAMNIAFEQGLLKVAQIFTDKLIAKEICIEEVCVNKEQLKALLDNNQINLISNYSNSPNETPMTNEPIIEVASGSAETLTEPATDETASSSEETIIESPSPTPEPTPEATPESTPEPTPEPSESPTPSPEPSESPTLEPSPIE